MKRKKVVLLGSTGSIGESTLKVAKEIPERVELVGLAAANSVQKLARQAIETGAKSVAIYNQEKEGELRELLDDDVQIYSGLDGLIKLAELENADMVLVAIVGTAGLHPAMAAIEAGRELAVASKEILVMAGELMMAAAERKGVKILPVDSEHNAIFQCLDGHNGGEKEISRLILTASGGPFRTWETDQLSNVRLDQAMNHPTWQMGQKITIDSATLFNKGLEMIEARWLFGVEMDKVDVIVHPQSIIHSMVEFSDSSVLAQLSTTDMCFPIQYAITYPERIKNGLKPLNFAELAKLEFEAVRRKDFPAIDLAIRAGNSGGTLPAVYNAANEIAVDAFIANKIRFTDIWKLVEATMDKHALLPGENIDEILTADAEARTITKELVKINNQ